MSSSEMTTSEETSSLDDESATGSDSNSDSESSDGDTSETPSESEESTSEEEDFEIERSAAEGAVGEERIAGIGVVSILSERILNNDNDEKRKEMTRRAVLLESGDITETVAPSDSKERTSVAIHSPQIIVHNPLKSSQPDTKAMPKFRPTVESPQNTPDQMDEISTKSNSSSDNPFASGGWGDEPESAPWEWAAMPLDYMGFLAEQRRTVFHEFRVSDGKGEWRCPKYSGPPNYSGISHLRFC
jgi:hypothetical protein